MHPKHKTYELKITLTLLAILLRIDEMRIKFNFSAERRWREKEEPFTRSSDREIESCLQESTSDLPLCLLNVYQNLGFKKRWILSILNWLKCCKFQRVDCGFVNEDISTSFRQLSSDKIHVPQARMHFQIQSFQKQWWDEEQIRQGWRSQLWRK